MAAIVEETARLIQMAWPPCTLQIFEVGMSNFRRFRETYASTNVDCQASSTEVQDFVGYLLLKKMAHPQLTRMYVLSATGTKSRDSLTHVQISLCERRCKGLHGRECPLIPGSQSHLICSANSLQFCPLFACLCMKQKCSLVYSH